MTKTNITAEIWVHDNKLRITMPTAQWQTFINEVTDQMKAQSANGAIGVTIQVDGKVEVFR